MARLRQLAAAADTLVDIAQTLTAERGDDEGSEVLVWARAVRGTLASYQRDVEETMPWAHDIEALLATLSDEPPENLAALRSLATSPTTLSELRDRGAAAAAELRKFGGARGRTLLESSIANLERSVAASDALIDRLSAVAAATKDLFETMQFDFLFDPTRKIFSIGYRVTDGSLDPSGYDLLASEARLASFIAIAKGDVPVSHWFRLGRPMTPVDLGAALVSWSGSMFEYLMPALVMKAPLGSLLEQTYRFVVRRQVSYGADHGVPWGISESAYNVRDLDLTYQYSNFGIPGLGLERGLSEDLVVAPYATALAAMVDPLAAARNLRAPGRRRCPRALRLLRGARLHALATPGRRARGDRPRLHGAPPGDDPRRAGERPPGRSDAGALSRGAHHPGDGAPVAGARPSRRGGRAPSRGRGGGARP